MSRARFPALSIVIPAYNEVNRLGATLDALTAWQQAHPDLPTEILPSIERSTDGTVALAEKHAAKNPAIRVLAWESQHGKGHAVRRGMLEAKGETVFFMDADMSTALRHIDQFIGLFEANSEADVIVGDRADPRAEITQRQSRPREMAGQQFNRFIRLLGLTDLSDTQCGFKAFRRRTVQPIFERQEIDGFVFDVEILAIAKALGFGIRSVPVEWKNSPESKVNMLGDLVATLRDLLAIRRRMRRIARETAATRETACRTGS